MTQGAMRQRKKPANELEDMAPGGRHGAGRHSPEQQSMVSGPPRTLPQAAFWGMVLVPWAMWFVATGLGLAHYDGAVGAPKELLEHLLAAYDRHVFRVWGALLPLPMFCLRVASMHLLRSKSRSAATAPPAASAGLTAPIAYLAITALRMLIYLAHVQFQLSAKVHVLGDHVLLAASVLAIVQSEMLLCVADVLRLEYAHANGAPVLRELGVIGAGLSGVPVYLLTCADMYITCRKYHHVIENAMSLVLGFVLFQLPIAAWHFTHTVARTREATQ